MRATAARLLGRIGPEASQTIPGIIAVLNERFEAEESDRSDANFARGLLALDVPRALGQIGPDRQAIAALADVINLAKIDRHLADEKRLRKESEQASARRKPGETRPLAIDDSVHWAEAARFAVAVQTLGEIGQPAVAAVPALIATYNRALETGWSLNPMTIPVAIGRIAPVRRRLRTLSRSSFAASMQRTSPTAWELSRHSATSALMRRRRYPSSKSSRTIRISPFAMQRRNRLRRSKAVPTGSRRVTCSSKTRRSTLDDAWKGKMNAGSGTGVEESTSRDALTEPGR